MQNIMMGDLPEHEDEWLGFRPTLPDYLPVIGPSKKYKNVFYCFGHHHLGMDFRTNFRENNFRNDC